MYVDTFNSDGVNWDLEDTEERKGDLRGKSVHVLGDYHGMINSVMGQIHQSGKYTESHKEMKPCMQKISEIEIGIGVKHTNSDGSSDEITTYLKAKGNEKEKETRDRENDTKRKDMDSRDREKDQG